MQIEVQTDPWTKQVWAAAVHLHFEFFQQICWKIFWRFMTIWKFLFSLDYISIKIHYIIHIQNMCNLFMLPIRLLDNSRLLSSREVKAWIFQLCVERGRVSMRTPALFKGQLYSLLKCWGMEYCHWQRQERFSEGQEDSLGRAAQDLLNYLVERQWHQGGCALAKVSEAK